MSGFFVDYSTQFRKLIHCDESISTKLLNVASRIKDVNRSGGTTWLLGNGGSNAIASHVAIDLTKNCRVNARCFSDGSEITCLANDFGHENWMAKAIELNVRDGDFVVLISSSGNSANITNAASYVIDKSLDHAAFSGMSADNRLRTLCNSDTSVWVDSKAYNFVEMAHQFYLLAVVDFIIWKTEYSA